MGVRGEYRPKLDTHLHKISENQLLPAKTRKPERKLSYEHRSTPLPGNSQQKLENKYMPLPTQTQQKSDNISLSYNIKNRRGSPQINIGLRLCQVRLNQS